MRTREAELSRLLGYIRENHGEALHGYRGTDINYILQILSDHKKWENLTQEGVKGGGRGGGGQLHHPQTPQPTNAAAEEHHGVGSKPRSFLPSSKNRHKSAQSHNNEGGVHSANLRHSGNQGEGGGAGTGRTGQYVYSELMQSAAPGDIRGNSNINNNHHTKKDDGYQNMQSDSGGHSDSDNVSDRDCAECVSDRHHVFHQNINFEHHVEQEEHDILHEVAHGLHFASIALLAFLVVEVSCIHYWFVSPSSKGSE